MSSNIKVVALTGGPCSGKTTLLEKLKGKDELCGRRLLFIPEVATLLSEHGLSFSDGEVMFQRAILSMQMSLEETYRRYATELPEDILIICDRGALDGAAYCGKESFDRLVSEMNTSKEELSNGYDAVIYLVSAAVGAESSYGKTSNEHRRESLDEAIDLENRTRACWDFHPNIFIVDNENKSFDDKINQANQVLIDILFE